MAGFAGTNANAAIRDHLNSGGVAVIVFSRNLADAEQLHRLTGDLACAATGPIIVATDQEPGRVNRLAAVGVPAPSVDSPLTLFASESTAMAQAMAEFGVNLNLAPIVDVVQVVNPALEGRSTGDTASVVVERAIVLIEAHQAAGVGTVAKHFPGHGLSREDPHHTVTVIDASLETLQADHLPPFSAALEGGVTAVMVGHPIYTAIDADVPASLSPVVLAMLRDDFGFDGVAMTDGLSMRALRDGYVIEEIAVAAIGAGQDLLLADRPSDVPRIVAALLDGVAAGTVDRDRLAEAAGRVRDLAASLRQVRCEG